ncbi:hypothetical protein [Luedemannella helvata]|uniref:hypothetical protein n=1 Tax=Luedemannella helvata TaxID=349315 RepID=UPI0031CE3526
MPIVDRGGDRHPLLAALERFLDLDQRLVVLEEVVTVHAIHSDLTCSPWLLINEVRAAEVVTVAQGIGAGIENDEDRSAPDRGLDDGAQSTVGVLVPDVRKTSYAYHRVPNFVFTDVMTLNDLVDRTFADEEPRDP